MTNTTPRSIPTSGLRHQAQGIVVEAFHTPQAGYLVQVRVNGAHHHALAAFNALVERYPAEAAAPAPVRTLPAPAKGTATHMSDAEAQVITEALESTGTIRRGRGYAKADIKMLFAMAKRDFVTLDHPIRPRTATVTDYGRRTAERLTLVAA